MSSNSETAKYVSDFFLPLSLSFSTIAYLLVQTNSVILLQLRQQNKTDYLFTTTIFYRIVSILASYGLSRKFGYSGIGIGSASAAWLTFILFQSQFLKETYSTYQLNNLLNIPSVNQLFSAFIQDGWQLALQRTTEWGNLFAITAIIGHFSPDELVAVEPSIQAMVFCNLFTQGIAQGLMYESTNNRAAKEKAGISFIQHAYLLSKDKRIFIIGNGLGFAAATINALILTLLRNNIINLFLNGNPDLLKKNPEQIKLANMILLLAAFSLIPDAVRQISGGILRGWGLKAMHHSTKNNLLLMTGAGVPLAFLWGYFLNDGHYAIPLFTFRLLTIVVSSLSNIMYFKKIYAKTGQDASLLSINSLFRSNHSTTRTILNSSAMSTESTHLMTQVNHFNPKTVRQDLNYQQISDIESSSNQGAHL